MTFEHILFIPSVLLLGVVLGYSLGARSVKKELEEKRARLKE